MARLFLLVLLCHTASSFAVSAFFAAPAPSGSLSVQLIPTEIVSPSVSQLVTFGVPFPRGSLTANQLNTLRVWQGNTEIPAYVDELTPWRSRGNSAHNGTSVRVARIQIHYTFASTNPETITVTWGSSTRQQDITTLVNPRNAWHNVTSGSYIITDGVEEPDVYALLPKAWLSQGVLNGVQSLPFDDTHPETRDDPTTNDGIAQWSGYSEIDVAEKNNFYTLINEDDVLVTTENQCPYKTDYEPWLYDRASAMFAFYFRSGFYTALREAVRAADFYSKQLNDYGFFALKDGTSDEGDTKYVYAENLAYSYWLTGDTTPLAKLPEILTAQDTFNDVWQNNPERFWTERHVGFKLLAHQLAYEVNGGSTQADKVATLITQLINHQNGANGQIPQPPNFVDGALYHYGTQHDWDWEPDSFGASSWMSVLIVDALLRAYASSEDPAIAEFIRRMGNFLRTSIMFTTENSYDDGDPPIALPRYTMLIDGTTGQANYEDVEHALDVATGIAWANYFAQLTLQPDPLLGQAVTDLYDTYDKGVNYWIRPTAPASAGLAAFRVAPWRKWAWEHRVSASFGWVAEKIFANDFEQEQ